MFSFKPVDLSWLMTAACSLPLSAVLAGEGQLTGHGRVSALTWCFHHLLPPPPHTPQDLSSDQCDSVVVSVESLLSDAKRMQAQCRERSSQLAAATAQLRSNSAALREQCEATQLDMAHIRRQLEELLETKSAFEAKERQARKLSKHLWRPEEEEEGRPASREGRKELF